MQKEKKLSGRTKVIKISQMEQVREKLIELIHYQKNCLAYCKRTEIAVDIVKQIIPNT